MNIILINVRIYYANVYQPIMIRVLFSLTISDTNNGACDLVQGTILRPTMKKHQNYTHHHLCLKLICVVIDLCLKLICVVNIARF